MDEYTPHTQIKDTCSQIYQNGIAQDLPALERTKSLVLIMQNPHKMYNIHQPLNEKNWADEPQASTRIKNILEKICNGTCSANRQIKDFLIKNNYIEETPQGLSLTSKLQIQTPDNHQPGGYTKQDSGGNTLIVINGAFAERSDSSVAVVLGHEITHCMINHKLKFCGTSSEIEALCDTVGMAAAKGAGYDISHITRQNNHDYDVETQARNLKPFETQLKALNIDIADKIQETLNFYQPEKLNKLAEIIDKKLIIPNNNQKSLENQAYAENLSHQQIINRARGLSEEPPSKPKHKQLPTLLNRQTINNYRQRALQNSS